MGWLDSLTGSGSSFNSGNGSSGFNNLFSGGSGNFGGSSQGFDWGSLWGDIGQSGGSYSDWSNLLSSGSSGSSGGGGWLQTIGNLMGGSGGSTSQQGGGNMYGDLFKGVLSGLGASADAKGQLEMAREVTKLKGLEDRKSTAFEAELLDFYDQRKNYRKHRALDMYSQFSRVSQFAPSFQRTYTGPADPGTAPQPKA